jgi:hypothetical protein
MAPTAAPPPPPMAVPLAVLFIVPQLPKTKATLKRIAVIFVFLIIQYI